MEERNKIKEYGCLLMIIWAVLMLVVIPFAYDFENVPFGLIIFMFLVILFIAHKMG